MFAYESAVTVWIYVSSLSPFVIVKDAPDQFSDLVRLIKTFNIKSGIQNTKWQAVTRTQLTIVNHLPLLGDDFVKSIAASFLPMVLNILVSGSLMMFALDKH